jgi:hypothetical protein
LQQALYGERGELSRRLRRALYAADKPNWVLLSDDDFVQLVDRLYTEVGEVRAALRDYRG